MADEKRLHDYDVAIATIGFLGAGFAGKLRPATANPYRQEPPRAKTQKEREQDSKEERALLGAGLKAVAEGRGNVGV